MNKKMITTLITVAILAIVGLVLYLGGFERNDVQNWQIVQSVWGKVRIEDGSGYYLKMFARVWTYPRYADFRYNNDPLEGDKADERIRVTFNDGGTAQTGTFVRVATPTTETERIEFHRQFGGEISNIKAAVKAHLTNCMKSTSPLMSASEHQSARKSEFAQHVENQLRDGLYESRSIEKELKDRFDEDGQPITVTATEILTDENNKPKIAQVSPLTTKYKMSIDQFSVTGTDYDDEILQQFSAKKQSFLAAEKSKAEREEMVQERLKIVEEGLKDKAQAEATANVEKATAVIQAEQKAEVALQAKIEAETKADMALAVAEIAKQEAQVKLDTAIIDANAIVVTAMAERERIEQSGAITEIEQAKIDAEVQIAVEVANGLSKIPVPSVVFSGGMGGDGASENDWTRNLINLKLMTDIGLFEKLNLDADSIDRVIHRLPAEAKVAPTP